MGGSSTTSTASGDVDAGNRDQRTQHANTCTYTHSPASTVFDLQHHGQALQLQEVMERR